jgi:CheY-like chemotaxis protein
VLTALFARANEANAGRVAFALRVVPTAAAALAAVRAPDARWDLVLLDYMLGLTTGDALIGPIRAALGPRVAIVSMSAHPHARETLLTSGADAFLHKPIPAHVVQHIWQFLREEALLDRLACAGVGRPPSPLGGETDAGRPHRGLRTAAVPSPPAAAVTSSCDTSESPALLVQRLAACSPNSAPYPTLPSMPHLAATDAPDSSRLSTVLMRWEAAQCPQRPDPDEPPPSVCVHQ